MLSTRAFSEFALGAVVAICATVPGCCLSPVEEAVDGGDGGPSNAGAPKGCLAPADGEVDGPPIVWGALVPIIPSEDQFTRLWLHLSTADLSDLCPVSNRHAVVALHHSQAMIDIPADSIPRTYSATGGFNYCRAAEGDEVFGCVVVAFAECGWIEVDRYDNFGAAGSFDVILEEIDGGSLRRLSGKFAAQYCPATE